MAYPFQTLHDDQNAMILKKHRPADSPTLDAMQRQLILDDLHITRSPPPLPHAFPFLSFSYLLTPPEPD